MKFIIRILLIGVSACGALIPSARAEDTAAHPVTLTLSGDVMLGRGVSENLDRTGPSYPLGNVAPILEKADLALVNLESVLASGGEKWTNPPRGFYFRADPTAVEVLTQAGVDGVTLANNHILDFGYSGLAETFTTLRRAGIRWAGAGSSVVEARKPALFQAGKLSVALLAATDNAPEYRAGTKNPGVWYLRIPPTPEFYDGLRVQINELRQAGVDLIIFSLHWGPNMREQPLPSHVDLAHGLIDAGVDIVHGHSAHVFQGIELYNEGIIFYDTGDLVDDYFVTHAIDEQFLYRVSVEEGKFSKIELIPVKIQSNQVNLADGETSLRAVNRMRDRSAPFGTEIRFNEGLGIINLKQDDKDKE
ncbi:MAG: CapA family protein [Candidatus Omnitrophota bacterium]|nr:CapA family protein [Candidatus Omnitrophota bacterium]